MDFTKITLVEPALKCPLFRVSSSTSIIQMSFSVHDDLLRQVFKEMIVWKLVASDAEVRGKIKLTRILQVSTYSTWHDDDNNDRMSMAGMDDLLCSGLPYSVRLT